MTLSASEECAQLRKRKFLTLFNSGPRRYSLPNEIGGLGEGGLGEGGSVLVQRPRVQPNPDEAASWHTSRQIKRMKPLSWDPTPNEQNIQHVVVQPVQPVKPSPPERIALMIGDTEKVMAYYDTALKHFQQLNCRKTAKAFIKVIEPRKQVKHPYNGGKGSAGEKGDPEKTKPEWWPKGVIHREPDHLRKDRGSTFIARS